MACGMTPDLARMLEQMADEKQRTAQQAEEQLQATVQQADLAKKRLEKVENEIASERGAGRFDWTKTYDKWDAWVDPEELARQEQEAREKSERAAKAARMAGCNHDHSAEQKLMDMTTTAKLDACEEFRRLGNLFFQHGQYQRAAYHYHKALVYFEYVFPENDAEEQWHDDLKLKALLNYTACRLKTHHVDDAIQHATHALDIDGDNVKALYRRAQGYRMQDDYDKAQQDLARAIQLSEGNVDPLLLQERSLLQAKMLSYKVKSKQVGSAMFGGAKDKSAAAAGSHHSNTKPTVDAMKLDLTRKAVAHAPPLPLALESWQPTYEGMDALEQYLNASAA